VILILLNLCKIVGAIALLLNSVFLVFLSFKSNQFKNQIDLLITGGAQPNFGPAHLRQIKLFLPSEKEEQSQIATILYQMDVQLERLETKKHKLSELKQGMMQELLTGKTRLI
jgi:type I restriction enzyme S subunit